MVLNSIFSGYVNIYFIVDENPINAETKNKLQKKQGDGWFIEW